MDFQRLDRIRIAAALVAAVLTGGAALFGVYQKSRKETQASYETLAPQLNALGEAVERLRVDVERVSRERADTPTPSAAPPPEPSPPSAPAAPSTVRRPRQEGPRAARTRREPAPPKAPPGQASEPPPEPSGPAGPSGPPPPTGSPVPTEPTTGTEPAPAEPPPASPPAVPPPEQPEVVEKIQKRVPIDFDKALEVWRDIQDLKKQAPK